MNSFHQLLFAFLLMISNVNEFVKKIIVHAPDKSSGHRRQKIELVWNFIGEVTCRATIRLWNGKEKAGRHGLSVMPSCDNQITSL